MSSPKPYALIDFIPRRAHLEDLLEAGELPANEEFRTALAHLICRAAMA
jgi:hypothetical protein